jgi:outer membrane protein OmpA-like peptidoglycan-associated protein/DNA-binding SARP family transcriptional activator
MPPQHQGSRPRRRGFNRLLRSLTAAVVLIAVMAGLPLLFVAVAGSPVPSRLPGWDQIVAALSRPDDGTLLLGFIKYLAWVLWALWALLVLLEAAAQIQGRSAPRIPGLDGPQRLAALLITSLGAIVIGTSLSISRGGMLPTTPTALSVSTAPPHSTAGPLGGAHRPMQAEGARTDLEAAASTWQADRPEQRQVTVRFTFDSAEVPSSARGALARLARDIREHGDPAHPVVITGHTDSLGPATYNQRLSVQRARSVRDALAQLIGRDYRFEVSGKGESAPIAAEKRPGGGDDPAARARNRRVEITYIVKQTVRPYVTPSSPPSPQRGNGDGPTTAPAAPPATPSAEPTPTSSRTVSAPTSQRSSVSTPSQDPPVTTSPTHPPTTVNLPSGAMVGLSFAAGVGTALAASRLHRRRRHRTPPSGPDLSTREPEPPPAVRRLRRADLAARESGHTDPAQAPPENGALHVFPLASSGRIVLGVRNDENVTVSIGGLVVGLAGAGGPGAARALLLALLTHAGDHDVEIVIPRGDAARLFTLDADDIDELARHIRALRVVSDLAAALRLLESERIHRARLLDTTADAGDLAAVRQADPTEPLTRLVLAAAMSEEHERRLDALAAAAGVYDMAVIGLGGHPAGPTAHLDNDGNVTAVDGPDTGLWQGLRMFHLTAGDAHQVLDVIRDAHGAPEPEPDIRPADEAAAADPALAPPVLEEPQAADERPVQLHVLGLPIVKADARELETGIRGKGRELLSYLAVYANGATRDAILAALWPDVDHKHAVMRFHAALHDVRRALRRATGLVDENFIVVLADRYRIDPDLVSVDLWRFHTALHRASQAEDDQTRAALLQEAADTYEGHLVAEVTYEQAYEWIEPEREALHRQAVEALIHLAGLYEAGEPERSLTVLERARTLDRYAEEVYQRIMTLQARLGRPDAVRRTYRLLETSLEELDVDPSQETQQLLWRLLRSQDRPQTL